GPSSKSAVPVPDAPTWPDPPPPSRLPPSPMPPLTTPSPPPVPSSARPSPPARRHSVFYYVFWGTISLFATLAVLFVGFVFLTGASAAFLMKLSHHPAPTKTAATQNLPA